MPKPREDRQRCAGKDADLSLGPDLTILLLDGLGTWWLWKDMGGTWSYWGTGDEVGCILAIDDSPSVAILAPKQPVS